MFPPKVLHKKVKKVLNKSLFIEFCNRLESSRKKFFIGRTFSYKSFSQFNFLSFDMVKTSISTNVTLVAPVAAKMHVGVWRKKTAYPRHETGNTTLLRYFQPIGRRDEYMAEFDRRGGFPCIIDYCPNVAEGFTFECRAHRHVTDLRRNYPNAPCANEHCHHLAETYSFMCCECIQEKRERAEQNELERLASIECDDDITECDDEIERTEFDETKAYKMQRDAENEEAENNAFQMPCVTRGCRNLCDMIRCTDCQAAFDNEADYDHSEQ